MTPETMIHMANQIALFFASYPRDEALAGVTDHIRKFWDPRMRRQIIVYVAEGGAGLHELALEAVRGLPSVAAPSSGSGRPPT
jgi:formate dehydrogenase subunit delta